MQVTISNQIRIQNPSVELQRWCKTNLVLPNPDYVKKVRMGFWVGNTPEKLYLYEQDGDTIILPFGTLRDILPILSNAIMREGFTEPITVDYGQPIPLYSYQEKAVQEAVRGRYGILQSPAGSGKTQMGIAIVREYGRRALWLTHTKDLLNQSKSVIGVILKELLGNAFIEMTTKEMVEQRFQIAQAENKLVLYDDDMKEASFESTGLLKKLITADTDIPAERKGKDPYTFHSYAKIIACANHMPSALYDNTNGFFRRIHPIKVKAPNPNRKNIDDFGKKMMATESEGVLRWALVGLRRLMNNNWKITWSDRSREFMNNTKIKTLNFLDFIDEALIDGEGDVSSNELYQVYKRWCNENSLVAINRNSLTQWFNDNACNYSFYYDKNITRNNKLVRGFKKLSVKPEWRTIGLIIK